VGKPSSGNLTEDCSHLPNSSEVTKEGTATSESGPLCFLCYIRSCGGIHGSTQSHRNCCFKFVCSYKAFFLFLILMSVIQRKY